MQALISALSTPEAAEALAGALFDFLIDKPIGHYLKAERVLPHLDAAFQEHFSERIIQAHLAPMVDREEARVTARQDTLRDWLTAEAIAELRAMAARPVQVDRRLAERLVQQPAVREMVSSIVQETLDRFISTFRPGGSGGGIAGRMGRRAAGLAGGVLGGVGAQLESQLKRAARQFVSGSMDGMLSRVVQIASSPETAQRAGRMKLSAFEAALDQPLSEVWRVVRPHVPQEDLFEILPGLLAHNLNREGIRDGLLEEARAALAIEGERTVRDWMAETDSVELWRTEWMGLVPALLSEFGNSEAFEVWWSGFAAV